jgi:hypothetical protein
VSFCRKKRRMEERTGKGEWISSVSVTVSMWLRYHQPHSAASSRYERRNVLEYMLRIHAKHDARIVIREIALLSFTKVVFCLCFVISIPYQ